LSDANVAITSRLNEAPTQFSATYEVLADSTESNFRFLFGGGLVPAGETVCVDNVELLDPEGNSVIQPEEPEVAALHTNQHGYLPALAKVATYKLVAEETATPRTWNLLDGTAQIVATGETLVVGADANSGDVVHSIDFSDFITEGSDYTLQVVEGSETISSHPFDISNELFEDLKYEALSYFYHNRSGIEILDTVVTDPKWARPAGHLDDIAVETFVCKDDPTADTCRTADVSGGWYDAGDHGKYVVNSGISVWTMLNQYERSEKLGRNSADYAANTMALPVEETANDMPDILDEAKWNIEWMLKMQIPAGETFAGMAYHKMHDDGWTGLGLAPHEDPQVRYIQAPTTAATLNLAAVSAQCYRVYKDFDADLADRCLAASKTALKAAQVNPLMLSGTPAADDPNPERYSMTNGDGGGMYNDDDVSDEMFWALAELYVSTKNHKYKKALVNHELYGRYAKVDETIVPTDATEEVPTSLFHWGNTNMLGAISIATAGNDWFIKKSIVETQVDLLVAAADNYVDVANEPGYSLPMNSDELEWGSNSGVVNNMIVLGVANDVACEQNPKYLNAMSNGLAYLMGNNPLGTSYVTGYGELAVEQPHHRFWANAENADYPTPPPGVMSGGPNSGHATTGDPVSIAKLDENCPAETCFVDHIGSWSTNEITINWNSPFAWAMAYMDEQSDYGLASESSCEARPMTGGAGVPIFLGLALLLLRKRKQA
jgi:endoglucanase